MNYMADAAAATPSNPVQLMYRLYKAVLPEVYAELARWRQMADRIPNEELRTQAIASMTSKQFHCEGGSIYAAANMEKRHVLVPLIVALQSISDYLDNLCDRSTSLDAEDFRLLHQSMLDAVNPELEELPDYYALREDRDDGGYLHALVRTCQSAVKQLPSYQLVQAKVSKLVGLYGDLQVYKHIRKDLRLEALQSWWDKHKDGIEHLSWNEFSAATGSTLGMFVLFLEASRSRLTEEAAQRLERAYFPHVCGLHILLDYLIDQEEDRQGGDLNFCSYYSSREELENRLLYIVTRAREGVKELPAAGFHSMVIEGLLAVYLSDPKARAQQDVKAVTKQLMKNSPLTRLFFWINSLYVRSKQQKEINRTAAG